MLKINILENPNFFNNTDGWTIGTGGELDVDEIHLGCPTINFNINGKLIDNEVGITSKKILVRPQEVYSASIYCRTPNYLLFDGMDSQITLYIYGYATENGSPTLLGSVGKNKYDFPAQDWFRLKIENIVIPNNIHYVSIFASIKRNGKCWFSYPCLELNNVVSNYDPFVTDIYGEYYNHTVYDDVLEIEEITKAQNITMNELNENTMEVSRNLYIITSDEGGIETFEDEHNISASPYDETLNFRRERLYNRTTLLIPYTEIYLREKLNKLIGEENYTMSIDHDNYTITVEYLVQRLGWADELAITINGIKPCNIIFINQPSLENTVGITEQVDLYSTSWNYDLDATWSLGALPFATFTHQGVIKLATTPSIQTEMLKDMATFVVNNVHTARIIASNDTYHDITSFELNVNNGVATLALDVFTYFGLSDIETIELRDAGGNVLSRATVSISVISDLTLKHTFTIQEVTE